MSKKELGDTKLHHDVGLGLVHLLTKCSQLRRQVGLHLLCLLPKVGLLLQLGKRVHQLLIESTNGLLILIPLFILYLLTFS